MEGEGRDRTCGEEGEGHLCVCVCVAVAVGREKSVMKSVVLALLVHQLPNHFCRSYQEVEEEGNHSPQEVGGKGVEGQVVWGEVADCQGGTLLLGGRGRRGLVTAMEIEGVKRR